MKNGKKLYNERGITFFQETETYVNNLNIYNRSKNGTNLWDDLIHKTVRNSKHKRSQRDSIARDKQQNQEWQNYIADFIVSWLIKFRNFKSINLSNSELHGDR